MTCPFVRLALPSVAQGNGPKARKAGGRAKKKEFKRSRATKCRAKDLDQIQDELAAGKDLKTPSLDEDLPGLGQFACQACDRFFINAKTLTEHEKTKPHKKRLKLLKEKPYSQEEAEAAAGMGRAA